jgi:hypothetical protein
MAPFIQMKEWLKVKDFYIWITWDISLKLGQEMEVLMEMLVMVLLICYFSVYP